MNDTSLRDKFRIYHILQAITRIYNFDKEIRDDKTRRAIERELIIVGEAANNISSEMQISNPSIPWKSIIGMRNILVHKYFSVNDQIIWDTVDHSISELRTVIFDIYQNE